jgi:hypothetical protein
MERMHSPARTARVREKANDNPLTVEALRLTAAIPKHGSSLYSHATSFK